MTYKSSVAVLTALLSISSLVSAGLISVNLTSRLLQDQYRRSVLLHGVNVVYKVDPYIPSSDVFDPNLSLTDSEIDDLVGWGFNFVRLGVMWEAVER
jgi:endoglycosylceramidase